MKPKMKIWVIIILAAIAEGCTAVYQRADLQNPCSSADRSACEQWRKDFPKEYAKYAARMKKSETKDSASWILSGHRRDN